LVRRPMEMLRTRLDAAAVGKLALVVGWYMLG
jgi:hypothetical protein